MAILIPVEDRVSTYPGRIKLTPVSGQANVYDLSRADEPVNEGTPLNKALLDQKAYILTEDTVVYVSPTGSDADGDGSSVAPFASIQKALDALPKLLGGYMATINVANGTYEERIVVEGFSGGKLVIGEPGRAVVLRGINVVNSNQVTFNIPNVTWASGFIGNIFQVSNNSSVVLASNMVVNCAGSSEIGVAVLHGGELLSNDATIEVSKCAKPAIRVAYGSRAALGVIAGTNNTDAGLMAESGAVLSYTTSTLTSTKGDMATTGGCILTGNGVPVPNANSKGKAVAVNSSGDGYTFTSIPVQKTFNTTIPATGWTSGSDGRYTLTVNVSGLLASDTPDVDVSLDGLTAEQEDAVIEAWGGAVKITTTAGGLVCRFSDQPEVAIPIKIKVVR